MLRFLTGTGAQALQSALATAFVPDFPPLYPPLTPTYSSIGRTYVVTMSTFNVHELRKLITLIDDHVVRNEETMTAEGVDYLRVSSAHHDFLILMYFIDRTSHVEWDCNIRD